MVPFPACSILYVIVLCCYYLLLLSSVVPSWQFFSAGYIFYIRLLLLSILNTSKIGYSYHILLPALFLA